MGALVLLENFGDCFKDTSNPERNNSKFKACSYLHSESTFPSWMARLVLLLYYKFFIHRSQQTVVGESNY